MHPTSFDRLSCQAEVPLPSLCRLLPRQAVGDPPSLGSLYPLPTAAVWVGALPRLDSERQHPSPPSWAQLRPFCICILVSLKVLKPWETLCPPKTVGTVDLAQVCPWSSGGLCTDHSRATLPGTKYNVRSS